MPNGSIDFLSLSISFFMPYTPVLKSSTSYKGIVIDAKLFFILNSSTVRGGSRRLICMDKLILLVFESPSETRYCLSDYDVTVINTSLIVTPILRDTVLNSLSE